MSTPSTVPKGCERLCRAGGVTYRQLALWANQGYFGARCQVAGSGSAVPWHLVTAEDVAAVKALIAFHLGTRQTSTQAEAARRLACLKAGGALNHNGVWFAVARPRVTRVTARAS